MKLLRPLPLSVATAVTCLVALGPRPAHADEGELTERQLGSTDAPYGFVEYVPPGYAASPGQKYAAVVFLHGAGEQGNGTTELYDDMTKHGPAKLIKNGSTYFADSGLLVFSPQSPTWWNAGTLHAFLGHLFATYRIQPERLYLTGISMGGGGSWDYVASHGGRLAAVLPICGASSPGDGSAFVGTPVWAFHAWGDPTVTRNNSIGWVDHIAEVLLGGGSSEVMADYPHQNGDTGQPAAETMTAAFDGAAWAWSPGAEATGSAPVRLTMYTDASHDSWTRTYDEPTVWSWLTAQQLPWPEGLSGDALIIDNLDAGASFEGNWARSEATLGFYSWDYHESPAADGTQAVFAAELDAGRYEVFLRYTSGDDRAAVDVRIAHQDGAETVPVDMKRGGGEFLSLGTYDFGAGMASVTLTRGGPGLLVADAVAFNPVPPDPPGTGGAGGGTGGGGATTSGAGGGGNADGAEDDGCSCRAAGASGSGASALAAAGLAAWIGLARRRRPRAGR